VWDGLRWAVARSRIPRAELSLVGACLDLEEPSVGLELRFGI
jgi:hypothetical protein